MQDRRTEKKTLASKLGSPALRKEKRERDEAAYFDNYAWVDIHEDMLKDRARTDAYRDAILQNRALFKDAVVLDVGCGTGILSLFAAKAGARLVYAVEASDMAETAARVVKTNKLESVVKVVKGKIEDVEIPDKVDVIISEWMGYFLVFESMLNSVIVARDRFLKDSGSMFPRHAKLHLGLFHWPQMIEEKVEFWDNVYGFDLSDIKPLAMKSICHEPVVDGLTLENEMTDSVVIKQIDCQSVTADELSAWNCKFSLKTNIAGDCLGYFAWFDVEFPCSAEVPMKPLPDIKAGLPAAKRRKPDQCSGIVLSTAPDKEETHWGQTLFYFKEPLRLQQDDEVVGCIEVSANPLFVRDTDVKINFETSGTLVTQGTLSLIHI